jgi:hypothetical protein
MQQQGKFGSFLAGALLIGSLAFPASAAPPDVDAKGLPSGFATVPLGTDDVLTDKQTVSHENGVFTLQAGGEGLANEVDGGMFVYQALSGNGSIRARLVSQTDGADDGLTQTAVSFRAGTGPGAQVTRLVYTSGNQLQPEVRVTEDAAPLAAGEPGSNSVGLYGLGTDKSPAAGRKIGSGIWIGIERNGNTFAWYWSEDGKVWNNIGGNTLALPAEALVGIEASKHGGAGVQTSVVDNVTIGPELIAPRSISGIALMPRDKSVIVTWNPVAVADGEVTYNVYQINANATNRQKVKEGIKGSSAVIENLTNGTQYRFAVTAVVNGVESGLQTPQPNSNNQNGLRRIGVAIPNPAVLGGLQLYQIGNDDPVSVTVTGEGPSAKINFKASGTNVWQSGDGVPFLGMPIEGNVDISARFVSGPTEANGGGWEHGGVMIRESLDPGSRLAYSQLANNNPLEFKRRRQPFELPTNTSHSREDNTARPITKRQVREGDTFTAFYTEDNGTTWKPLENPDSTGLNATNKDTLPGFAKTAFVGIVLCAHHTGEDGHVTEAEIDNVVIKPLP